MTLPPSVLVKDQKIITPWKEYREGGHKYRIRAEIRYDDQCGNGHNSFSITGTQHRWDTDYRCWQEDTCGCIHELIEARFPEYAQLIKWHLTSSDGPMHYEANVLYWLGWKGWTDSKPNSPPNIAFARSSAVWPELPESFIAPMLPPGGVYGNHGQWRDMHSKGLFEDLQDPVKAALRERLPALMVEFKRDIEALGFTY